MNAYVIKTNFEKNFGKKMKNKNFNELLKKIAIILVLVLSISFLQAQTITYQWANNAGGNTADQARSIAIDASGNVYTTGVFTGTVDFDPSTSTYNLTSNGDNDIYICKYNSTGGLVWAVNIGGTYADNSNSIALDASGNVFVTGSFMGTVDFDPGTGSTTYTSVPNTTVVYKTFIRERNDIFILKLNNSGSFVWAKAIGAGGDDVGNSITLDPSNNVIITGIWADLNEDYDTLDFNTGAGVNNLIGGGSFVLKLDNSGDFIWACSLGMGIDKNKIIYTNDYGYYQEFQSAVCKSVKTDASGKIYIAGEHNGKLFYKADFDPDNSNTYYLSVNANLNAFVWVLNSNGTFVLAKQFGDFETIAGYCSVNDIAIDGNGNIFTIGYFRGGIDFDPGSSSYKITSFGYNKNGNYTNDMFVSKISSSGNFLWAKQIGGQSDDNGLAIALAGNGSVYCTGYFSSKADFNPSKSTYYFTSKGSQDAFLLKLDASGNFKLAYQTGGTESDRGADIALSGSSSTNIYICGYFGNTVDMDPGSSTANITSSGGIDAFVQKINESTSFNKKTSALVLNELKSCYVYPNPASNAINVELGSVFETGSISIYSINEAFLIEKLINNQQFIELDINHLPQGLYYLKIKSKDFSKIIKFVKY